MSSPTSAISTKPPFMLVATAVALFCVALGPVVAVHIPPLVDYPNHMARMRILADGGHSDYLRQYYEIHWDILPNLGMDLIVPLLARVVPLPTAGKIFIGMTLLQLSGGVIALHYALHRRWSWWPLLAMFFLYNSILVWGFLNYLFGLGMVMWVFAVWVTCRHRPSWQTIPLFTLLAVLLFFCHLFAFGIYVFVLAGYEAGQRWGGRRLPAPSPVNASSLVAIVSLTVPLILLLLSPTFRPHTEEYPMWAAGLGPPPLFSYAPLSTKVEALKGTIRTDHTILDRITAIALIALISVGLVRRQIVLTPAMYAPLALVATVVVCMPTTFGAMGLLEIRMPIALVFFIIASLDWQGSRQRWTKLLGTALALLFLARMGSITYDWLVIDRHYVQFLQALDRMPKGSRLFSGIRLESGDGRVPESIPMANLPCWAVLQNEAFVSDVFSAPSQQPIQLTPLYRKVPTIHEYTMRRVPIPWDNIALQHDYVVVRKGQYLAPPPPDTFIPIFSGDLFVLYRLPVQAS